ncbi:MAG: hypothetical protein ACLU6Y_05265 [Ruminococcus sp.]
MMRSWHLSRHPQRRNHDDQGKEFNQRREKRIESLDKRIEKIQNKIAVNRKEYDAMTKELQKLLEERYPEMKRLKR